MFASKKGCDIRLYTFFADDLENNLKLKQSQDRVKLKPTGEINWFCKVSTV